MLGSGCRAVFLLCCIDVIRQLLNRCCLLRQRRFSGLRQFGELRQPVCADQLLGGRRAVVIGGKPVPAAQFSIAGNQPLPRPKRFALVYIDDADERQTRVKFGRGTNMVDKAGTGGARHIAYTAKPAPAAVTADTGIGIVPQCGGQCALKARFDRDMVYRLIAGPFCQRTFERPLFGQQRGQFGFRAGKLCLCSLALFGQLCSPEIRHLD